MSEAGPAVSRSRVGFVPARANRVRDGIAVALLLIATLLPWSIEFGVGVPGSNGLIFVALDVVTLLSVGAALAPYLGPWALSGPNANPDRTATVRYWLNAPYFVLVLGFIVFHLVQTVRDGGTGMVPPGSGPGMWLGIAGALLASQPVTW